MEATYNRPQLRRCGDVGRIALYKAAISSHLDEAEGIEEPLNRQIPRRGVRTTACCCCCNALKPYIHPIWYLVSEIILVLVIPGTKPRGYHHRIFFRLAFGGRVGAQSLLTQANVGATAAATLPAATAVEHYDPLVCLC